MSIVDRVKNLLVSPATEWPVIAAESTPQSAIVTGYVLPLAAVSAAAAFIGMAIVGYGAPGIGMYRMPIATALVMALWAVLMAVVACFVVGLIINALAPTFGAVQSDTQAFKVAAYSFTPAWVAGMLRIIPMLGILAIIGAIYAIYLLYLGLQSVMKAPADKAVGYTAAVAVVGFVVMIVLSAIGGMLIGASMFMAR